MSWFGRMKSGLKTRIKREIPHGIWRRCDRCGHSTYEMALQRSRWICPECSYHFPIGHRQYIDLVADPGSFVELDAELASTDPLRFRDTKRYADRLRTARRESGLNEAICTGVASIGGHAVALGVMDTRFVMGSLGSATGERIVRLTDRAMVDRRPLIIISQSAGARMMEGAYSLMQMAKISAKLHELSDAGLLYISVLTDPTYGGVTASYAMLGDVILAEPGARVGFAGQAVIKQFLGSESLPEGFQLAETVFEHGFIDRIVRRDLLAGELARLIGLLGTSAEQAAEPAGRA
ncbi:MAG: acetyl-CoA carboxylase, carboxyltransferase subunit beta [Candidatus Latescibacterota bacterium]